MARANVSNRDRKEKNILKVYCFECNEAEKPNRFFSKHWYHNNTFHGDLIVLYNMLIYMMRANRSRGTLKNKFGRTKTLPKGFSPDVEDRLIEEAKIRELDKFL